MKITKIETKANGETTIDKYDVSKDNYEIIARYWVASDNTTLIKDWTPDDYISQNPNEVKILPLKLNEREIDVVAHTLELRRIYATRGGKRIAVFNEFVTYPINKENQNENS